MINQFKKEQHTDYKDKLRNAFPKALRSDVDVVLSILPFDNNNVKRTGHPVIQVDNLIYPSGWTVQFDSEVLSIPYRIYFNEPVVEEENKLTDTQKTILNCIYLRHFDGYLRQRKLEALVEKNDNWIIPFTIQLLGEYVFEIIQVLDLHVNDKTMEGYVKFFRENRRYWEQTESRMISYWNEYSRRQYPNLKMYPGKQIADRIKKGERIITSQEH